MEREPKNGSGDKLDKKKVQKFITQREILAEDFSLIEKLVSFPKDMLITELHNMFNMNRDRSGKELEGLIERSRDPQKTELFKIALEFCNKYGWETSWHLVRVLEEI